MEDLDVVQDRDGHHHVQRAVPVDMEKELHTAGFDPADAVRTDVRDVDVRGTKDRTAESFRVLAGWNTA
jgi:hypothetical protein